MDDIKALTEIDYGFLFVTIVGLLLGAKALVSLGEYWIGKLGLETKWSKKKKEEHDMLLANAQAIKDLTELHKRDTEISNEHDVKIRKELSTFMNEVRTDIKTFTENRVHDREQSLEIQKELKDSIQVVANSQKDRDKQVEALMCGSKELLGNTIDERFAIYVALGGIPQDEVEEFESMYQAYHGLKGNSGRHTKYLYVKEHLEVIPTKTELVYKE